MRTQQTISQSFIVTTAIDGDDAMAYIIEATRDNLIITGGSTSATWTGVISFYRKEGALPPESWTFYSGIALRKTDGSYEWKVSVSNARTSGYGTVSEPFNISNISTDYTSILVLGWNERPTQTDIANFSCLNAYTAKKEIPVIRDGQNSVHVDLDNEHEDFLYNDVGTRVAPVGGATSQARLFDGIAEQGVVWYVSCDGGNTFTRNSNNFTTGTVAKAKISSGGLLTVDEIYQDTAKVVVRATYNREYYYATFTANKKRQDKYDLVLSENSIAYNPEYYTSQTQKTILIYATRTDLQGNTSGVSISFQNPGTFELWATYDANDNNGRTAHCVDDFNYTLEKLYLIVTPTIASRNTDIYFELRKYNDTRSSYTVLDYETVPINKAVNGEAAWLADLDNEMDAVSCDDTGYPIAEQTVQTTIALFHGVTAETFFIAPYGGVYRNGSQMLWNSGTSKWTDTGVEVTFNDATGVLSVKYGTTAKINNGKDEYTITVQNTDNDISRDLHFIVNGINGDVYNLKPGKSEIVATRNSSNTFNTTGIICGYTRKEIDGTITTVDDITETYSSGEEPLLVDGKYNIWYRLHVRATGDWETTVWQGRTTYAWYAYNYDQFHTNIVSNFNPNTYDAVEFILCSEVGNYRAMDQIRWVVDRETVHVVADGSNGRDGIDGIDGIDGHDGADAVVYELESVPDKLKTNASYTQDATARVRAYKIEGSSRSAYTQGMIYATPTYVDGSPVIGPRTGTSYVDISVIDSQNNNKSVEKWQIQLYIPGGQVAVAGLTVPVIPAGPTLRGPRVWASNDGFNYLSGAKGEAFIDLVIHEGNYYQCITSHTASASYTPGQSSAYWLAATQFDFVATNLLLAERAKIVNLVVEELEARHKRETSGPSEFGWYSYLSGGEFEIGTYTTVTSSGGVDDRKVARYKLGMVKKTVGNVQKEYPVIQFCDENGTPVGQIDESLFANAKSQLDSWSDIVLVFYDESNDPSGVNNTDYNSYANRAGTKYYQYSEGFTESLGQRSYTIGLWTGNDSYNKAQHSKLHGKYLPTMNIDNDTYKKGGYGSPVNGYYIDPRPYKQFKDNGTTVSKRSVLDVYKSTSDGIYKGQMTKVGILATTWEDTGLQPVPAPQ